MSEKSEIALVSVLIPTTKALSTGKC